MIFSFLAAYVLAQGPITQSPAISPLPPMDQPQRLRTLLPNGACILVERVPTATSLAIDLFLSARNAPEAPGNHGLRHLFEHLSALGKDGTLDRRLETAGGFLRAFTLRDATVYALSLPADGLKIGVSSLAEVVQTQTFSKEDIQKESQILAREGDLRSIDELASAEAWRNAYGTTGLDPFGNLDLMSNTTPEELAGLRKALISGDSMTVTVVGSGDLDQITQQVSAWLSLFPKGSTAVTDDRHRTVDLLPVGVVATPDIREPFAAALLAAGLALASESAGASFTYTPSTKAGLMRVGSQEENLAATLPAIEAAPLFARGLSLAHRWVDRQLQDPSDIAFFRGYLLSLDRGLRPELMHNRISGVTPDMFLRASRAFQGISDEANRGAK